MKEPKNRLWPLKPSASNDLVATRLIQLETGAVTFIRLDASITPEEVKALRELIKWMGHGVDKGTGSTLEVTGGPLPGKQRTYWTDQI